MLPPEMKSHTAYPRDNIKNELCFMRNTLLKRIEQIRLIRVTTVLNATHIFVFHIYYYNGILYS
jgi:hypothetical protein